MSNQKIKVMVMIPDLPFPVQSGGRVRAASMIEALASFCTVHIACLAPALPDETHAWISRLNGTIETCRPIPASFSRNWLNRMRMAIFADNLVAAPANASFFGAALSSFAPDIVWLETPYLLPLVLHGPKPGKIIVDYWGTAQGALRDWRAASGPRKIWERLRWRAARGGELRSVPMLTDIVTVSEPDARYFAEINPRARIHAIPNGISKTRLAAKPDATRETPELMVMTGDLSYRPNIDAARYFTHEILPLIRARRPEARIRFAGRAPAAEALELNNVQGVEVTGFVPDLADIVADASIYVLPMRLGSGIRSKLLEVFPLAKAIVSTTIGAEGLALEHGENCLLADEPEEFANACIKLLAEKELRRRLGAKARLLAETVYSQDAVEQIVRKAITACVSNTGNTLP